MSATAALEWVGRLRGQEAATLALGADAMVCLPHFNGIRTPLNRPEALGRIEGLHPGVTPAVLGYATMEGVALQFAACSDRFEGAGKVDVVFDLIGGETQTRLWAIRGNGRRLVSTSKLPDDAKGDAVGTTGVFVFTPPDGQILAQIVVRICAGHLKPLPVGIELAFKDAAETHRLGETGKASGKMVLLPDNLQ